MKINKKEIINVLDAVKPGLSNKEIIEFTNTFYFTGSEVITFNDEICIRYPFETEFTGGIIAEKFISILNKMGTDKDGNIDASFNEEESELILKNKRSSCGIVLNSEGQLPLEELNTKIKKWKKLPDNFIYGSKLSFFCTSDDNSLPILTCLFYDGKTIKTTNRYRAFEFTLNSKISEPFLIPAFVIPTLSRYKIIKYNIDGAWVHFKTKDNIILSIRTFPEGKFPDISSFFDVSGETYIFPDTINDILDKSIVFSEGLTDKDKMVSIHIKGKKLIISSKSSEGWSKDIVICQKYDGNINMEINPIFLKDILKETKECQICQEPTDSMRFQGDNWKHVLSITIND